MIDARDSLLQLVLLHACFSIYINSLYAFAVMAAQTVTCVECSLCRIERVPCSDEGEDGTMKVLAYGANALTL